LSLAKIKNIYPNNREIINFGKAVKDSLPRKSKTITNFTGKIINKK